ncbi:MAG TPA: MFS transporter [Candidatus Nanopelagicales bacterium]|nr:MFS transporter [Candidatus Nanopelagicales bacterium]
MALPAALSALRSRTGLRRVLLAYGFYNFVELACWLAIVLWAYGVGGAALAGTAAVVQLVPSALMAPALASAGDRMSRGTALVLAHGAVAVATAITWVALQLDAPVWAVIAASTCITTTVAVVRPVHYAALPQLARGADELVSGNALSAVGEQLALFLGPVVAGVVVQVSGPELVLAIAFVASVIGTLLCLALPLGMPDGEAEPDGGSLRAALAGLIALKGDPASIALLLAMALTFVVGGSIDVLGVAYSDEVLGQGESGAGLVIGAVGVGGLIGAAAATTFAGGRRLVPIIAAAGAAMGLLLSTLAAVSQLWPAVAVVATVGLIDSVLLVCARTLLQRATDDRVLSRVFAVQESMSLLGLAVGAALAPVLLERFSPSMAFLPLGIGLALLLVVAALLSRPLDARAVFRPRETGLLRAVSFLGALPAYELERLAQRVRWVEAAAGAEVVTQGDWGEHFYVIEEGRCTVQVDGVLRDHVLGPRDSFGEIALLHRVPRTATITASEPSWLLAIDAPDFLAAVTGSADGGSLAREVAAASLARDSP